MPETKRPYSQVADFADLPSALHYLWYTFHYLPNSFPDLRTQQVLTSDCIKTNLLLSINSAKLPVEDFCFNLTCRLCYNKFKSLKTTNAALLAYICHVFTKVQSAPKTVHSSVDEAVLLGRFPLPSRQVIEKCLHFYETRPKTIANQVAPSRNDSNLQVLQSTSCFNPFPRKQESPKPMGPTLGTGILCQRSRLASNPVLNKYDADLSYEDEIAAQKSFDNLGTFLGETSKIPSTSSRYESLSIRSPRSYSPPSSAQRSNSTRSFNRAEASPALSRRSRSRSRSPTSSQETQPLTCTYLPHSPSLSPSQRTSPAWQFSLSQ